MELIQEKKMFACGILLVICQAFAMKKKLVRTQ